MKGGKKRAIEAAEDGGAARNVSSRKTSQAGIVVRVKVKNFMTYSECDIKPGRRLNLVLGANGTGKSSFVCALCVGLGGSTKLLGRADSVKEFIRNGQEEGSTEVWLTSEEPNKLHKIYRKIRSDNKSEWKIDGHPSTAAEVKKVVRKYNIQLDNLCQFLPQDKVVEFARLKPNELLTETQKALGDAHLHDMHQQLIQQSKGLRDSQSTLASYTKKLEQLMQANEGLERDVERFQKRQALLDKVEIRQQKKPWIEYSIARDRFKDLKDEVKAKEAELKNLEKVLQEEERPLREAEAGLKKLHAKRENLKSELRRATLSKDEITKDMDSEVDKIEALKQEIADLADQSEIRRKDIETARRIIDKVKSDLEMLPDVENPEEQRTTEEHGALDLEQRNLESDIRRLRDSLSVPQHHVDDYKRKIKRFDDHKTQKLKMLESKFRGVTKVWEWVQENQSSFQGKVWGPILAEVNTNDAKMAQYLEMAVPNNVWGKFVTVHATDQKLLVQQCHKLLGKHNIIVSNFRGNPDTPLSYKNGTAAEYAKDGIIATLDSCLKETPSIVAHILDDEAGITRCFVGGQQLKSSYPAFLDKNERVQKLFLPDTFISVSGSIYNRNAKSKEVMGIRQGHLLSGQGFDDSQKEILKQRLREAEYEIETIQKEIRDNEAKKSAVFEKYEATLRKLTDIQTAKRQALKRKRELQLRLRTETKKLESAERSADPMEKGPDLRVKLGGLYDKIAAKVAECTSLMRSTSEVLQSLAAAELSVDEAGMLVKSLSRANAERKEAVNAFRAEVAGLEQTLRVAKEETRRLKRLAETNAPLPEDPREREAYQNKLMELPDELHELMEEINALMAEADAITCSNPRVLDEYKKRCEEIKKFKELVQEHGTTVQNGLAQIQDIKGRWLPELLELVDKINETFRVNFAEIGCAGEVVLHQGKDNQGQDDFEKFEIQIRVKFRDEEDLQVLTSSRQSGGERSVCTILYLIALQGVTECPFRVVDEINQGMDPNNERKVFRQLVECACRRDTPQCFLLTPKLLPDLPFSEDVRVLNIFNGPWVADVARSFTIEDFLPAEEA